MLVVEVGVHSFERWELLTLEFEEVLAFRRQKRNTERPKRWQQNLVGAMEVGRKLSASSLKIVYAWELRAVDYISYIYIYI